MNNHDKPTAKMRREKIKDIIIRTGGDIQQKDVIKELVILFECGEDDIKQGDIAKDFMVLGLKRIDGKYAFPEKDNKTDAELKLKKIALESGISLENMIPANTKIRIMIISSKNKIYNHLFAEQLIEMFPDVIVDVVCTDRSIMIYYKAEDDAGNKTSLRNKIRNILE